MTADRSDASAPRPGVLAPETALLHSSSSSAVDAGLLNPPVHRASTIVYDTLEAYLSRHDRLYDGVVYGLYGTETTFALAAAIAKLEHGHQTVITSSGTAAIALSLAAFLKEGDHALVIDTAYRSTRRFCDEVLTGYGVEISYFDPGIGAGVEALLRPNTRMVFLEAPGSMTFEIPDVRAITQVTRRHGVITALDNTWATPLFFRPIEHGVDISIAAATKYLSGHSDVMLGAMTAANADVYTRIKDMAARWGNIASPDDCYLVHRGLRTLDVRLERHQRNALELAQWFDQQPEVRRVLLEPLSPSQSAAFFNGLRLFRLGSSWGGFESLLVPAWPPPARSCLPVDDGTLIRVHAGLEASPDLIGDLDDAFRRLRAISHQKDA